MGQKLLYTQAGLLNQMDRLEEQMEREYIFEDAVELNIHFMTLQEPGCKTFKKYIVFERGDHKSGGITKEYRGLA